MENTKKQLNFWRCAAIIELVALLIIGIVFANGRGAAPAADQPTETPEEVAAEPLTLWSEGSAPKQKLIDFVTSVTDETSMDFIPVEDRIAVFDMDGTLACETYYTYLKHL